MRTEDQIKDRIRMAVIENMQVDIFEEPENVLPKFVENLTNVINEIVLDEIMMRKRI